MADQPPSRVKAKDINDQIRYTSWSVFRSGRGRLPDRVAAVAEVEQVLATAGERGVIHRGWYDVGGLRADADIMLWLHAETSDLLQDTYHEVLRTTLGATFEPVWSQLALHRPAEFKDRKSVV